MKESFECPRCYGKGSSVADARKQCDENMKYEDCKWIGNKDLICATEIYSDQYESTVERSCEKKENYDSEELECFNSRDEKCGMAMCNTTRCKAVVNMPGINDTFILFYFIYNFSLLFLLQIPQNSDNKTQALFHPKISPRKTFFSSSIIPSCILIFIIYC